MTAPRHGGPGAPGVERLREVAAARQHAGDAPRRWFSSTSCDLYVWHEGEEYIGFEFCYGKPHRERSIRWHRDSGSKHARIDDGEASPLANRTPIAVSDEQFDADAIARDFERVAGDLEPGIRRFVLQRLRG